MTDATTYVDRFARLGVTLAGHLAHRRGALTTGLEGLREVIQATVPFLDARLFPFDVTPVVHPVEARVAG